MPDPIESVAATETEKAPVQTPEAAKPAPKETRDEAAGKAVAAARFFARMNKLEKPEEKEEKKVEPKEEAKPEAKEEPPKKEKPEPPPEDVKVSKRKPKLEAKKELVDALAEAQKPLVEAIQKQQKQEAKAPEPVKPVLSKSDEKMVARLKKLEEINPNYAGASDNYLSFKEKEKQYQADWEKKNPDSEFDPEDSEHSKWYERNEPSVDSDDFEEAKEALVRDQAEKVVEERIRKEFEPLKRKQAEESAVAKAAPKIEKSLQTIGRNAAAAIDPEFGKLKDLSKIGEENPIAAEILTDAANRWMPIAQAASLLYSGHPVDDNNPVFQEVGKLVGSLEEQVSQLDEDSQVRNGKQFATISEYAKMSPREQARHWYIGEDELVEFVGKRMAYEAKTRYSAEVERAEKLAAKLGYVRNSGQSKPAAAPQKQEEETRQQQSPQSSVRVGGAGAPPPAPSTSNASAPTVKGRLAQKLGW